MIKKLTFEINNNKVKLIKGTAKKWEIYPDRKIRKCKLDVDDYGIFKGSETVDYTGSHYHGWKCNGSQHLEYVQKFFDGKWHDQVIVWE